MSGRSIDTQGLMTALEDGGHQAAWYLDRHTGNVLRIGYYEPGVDPAELERVETQPQRYTRIQPLPSARSWQLMADFVAALPDPALRSQLTKVLEDRKPFRRFRQALAEHPTHLEQWLAYKTEFYAAQARTWLAALEPVDPPGDTSS